MKILIDSQELKSAVSKSQKFVGLNSHVDVLSSILLQANEKENKLYITAGDGIVELVSSINAKIFLSGKILVDYNVFSKIINKLDDGDVSIESRQNEVYIFSKGIKSQIKILDAEKYPKRKKESECKSSFALNQIELKKAFKECLVYVSKDDARPILKGIFIENTREKTVSIVSCDGYRMTKREIHASVSGDGFSIIVPGTSINAIYNLLSDINDDIEFFINDNFLSAKIGNCIVETSLLQGKYIEYKKILQHDSIKDSIKMNVDKLRKALDVVCSVSSMDSYKRIEINLSNGKMTINSSSINAKCMANLDIDFSHESEFSFCINSSFLMNAVKLIEEEYFDLLFTKPNSPIYLKTDKIVSLILPMSKQS